MPQTIVIKIGSNVLTHTNGMLDTARLYHIVAEISAAKKEHRHIVLVSSGAVASGRQLITPPNSLDTISKRQLWAAVGQARLIQTYREAFEVHQQVCAQVLVTKEDFRDRRHYLNMKNCLLTLLDSGVIPIINENDVISVTELMFTDNDELAGLVASMVNASQLIILSNVDGVFTGNPDSEQATLIKEIAASTQTEIHVQTSGISNFGRGGMMTKLSMARKTAQLGIPVIIANGKKNGTLSNIFSGEAIGTQFIPAKKKSSTKKWLAHAHATYQGEIMIDEGAQQALFSDKPTSLLPVGIINITGKFKKGDIVRIISMNKVFLGLGKTAYDSEKAWELMGKKNQKVFIHYDYLYLTEA
jgi:glutamate 5-kinase